MRSFLIALLGTVLVHTSYASVQILIQPVPITPEALADDPMLANAQSVDFVARVTDGSGFRGAGVFTQAPPGGSFYQHPFGGIQEPAAAAVALFPSLGYDTYLTVPPGGQTDSGRPFVGSNNEWSTAELNQAWLRNPGLLGNGDFRFLRITWFGPPPSGIGRYLRAGESLNFSFTLPEPASACWLGLCAVLLRRCRRAP